MEQYRAVVRTIKARLVDVFSAKMVISKLTEVQQIPAQTPTSRAVRQLRAQAAVLSAASLKGSSHHPILASLASQGALALTETSPDVFSLQLMVLTHRHARKDM